MLLYVDDKRKQKGNDLRMDPSFGLNSVVVQTSVYGEEK